MSPTPAPTPPPGPDNAADGVAVGQLEHHRDLGEAGRNFVDVVVANVGIGGDTHPKPEAIREAPMAPGKVVQSKYPCCWKDCHPSRRPNSSPGPSKADVGSPVATSEPSVSTSSSARLRPPTAALPSAAGGRGACQPRWRYRGAPGSVSHAGRDEVGIQQTRGASALPKQPGVGDSASNDVAGTAAPTEAWAGTASAARNSRQAVVLLKPVAADAVNRMASAPPAAAPIQPTPLTQASPVGGQDVAPRATPSPATIADEMASTVSTTGASTEVGHGGGGCTSGSGPLVMMKEHPGLATTSTAPVTARSVRRSR
jgi:hypothetical protein